MLVLYGYRVKEFDDPFLELARKATEGAESASFGNFLVDLIPWRAYTYLPELSNLKLHYSEICSSVVSRRKLPREGCGVEAC